MAEIDKPSAINTKSALKLLGCSRSVFYQKHHHNLKCLGKQGRDVLYDMTSAKAYAETINKFNIVQL